ncbi:MAG: c-type cytochrome, partial [Emcibacter sp.]|nr:c-type cytochrome [Emcibacter sp.]
MPKIPAFWQAVLVIVIAYFVFDNAFPPVMPATLLTQYMIITIAGVLLYFSFDDERWAEFMAPIKSVLKDDDKVFVRWGFLVAIPAIIGFNVYGMVKPSLESPVELRQVHPAPPSKMKAFGKTFDLTTLENPIRTKVVETYAADKDAAKEIYTTAVEAGREVYYQNCFYCHGDLLDGKGPYAKGFNPKPANFQDVGTIAQLEEGFLFWRITTGGPGLPKGGTPWNSAMPVWHELINEDQVWNVITFLYDYVGQVPRMWDADTSKVVTGIKDGVMASRKGQTGMALYQHRCAACHGEDGFGDGAAADYLYPKPRDFSLGLFKYKSSPGSLPPRDEDLIKVIKHGLDGTGMPGWDSILSDDQIKSLVPVLKFFDTAATWAPDEAEDEDFDDEGRYLKTDFLTITDIEPVDGQIAYSSESVAEGRATFEKVCGECHGKQGRG